MLIRSVSYVLKIEYLVSYSSSDIVTVMPVAHCVHYMLQTCLKMPMLLINCTVNNALVSATVPHELHFTDIIQLWLINLLLDQADYRQ